MDYHKKGQYFTTNKILKQNVYKLILNDPKIILEPSIGQGDLVDFVLKNNNNINFHLYEIDNNIKLLNTINKKDVVYGDFLKQNIKTKYITIIGNPPYVKTKKGNLYIDFIEKCYNLLDDNGELIFIVPSDFIKLTSSCKIINIMMNNGTFTHIFHPNNEKLFKNASIDVIVFRYCKNKILPNKILYNNIQKYLINTNGILTFSDDDKNNNYKTFDEYFDIYVGMVSGKEKVFKIDEFGNINILNKKNLVNKYILINNFPTNNDKLNNYMLNNKSDLIKRKIKKFNEKNWFKWGALRNFKSIKNNLNKKCIYIHNLTRNKEVCFESKVQFFGGNLIIMIPKKDLNISKLVNYINSDTFKSNYMYSNRFKIGHKQLKNCNFIPSQFL